MWTVKAQVSMLQGASFGLTQKEAEHRLTVSPYSMEIAPVSYPDSQGQCGSLLLQEKYPEAHKLRRRFGLSCIQTGAEVASPREMFETARGSTQRAKVVPSDTISEAQRERAEGRGVRMNKHIKFLLF